MNAEMRDFAIREIGCICCLIKGRGFVPAEKHHLLTTGLHGNGRRRGEQYTIGLCSYHHQGEKAVGTSEARRLSVLAGPSYGDEPVLFREEFGTDAELLELQDRAIAAWADSTIGGVR